MLSSMGLRFILVVINPQIKVWIPATISIARPLSCSLELSTYFCSK